MSPLTSGTLPAERTCYDAAAINPDPLLPSGSHLAPDWAGTESEHPGHQVMNRLIDAPPSFISHLRFSNITNL